MIDLRFKPLPKWPGTLSQSRDAFKTTYSRTLDLLEYELGKLRATQIIIEAGFSLKQIGNTGWPLGKETPSYHPGVVLYFTGKNGAMRFPAGTYARWQANVHALALTLESLRAIDRYGVTHGEEQYRGFAAIAAPGAAQSMTAQVAAELVLKFARLTIPGNPERILKDKNEAEALIRIAKALVHPDRFGNAAYPEASAENWAALAVAIEVIKAYHKERFEADQQAKFVLNV